MLSASAQVWCVCITTRAPQMRWIGAWMHCAESSTTPSPSSVCRTRRTRSCRSRALPTSAGRRAGSGSGRRVPGTVTVKWLSMPSSSSWNTARRCAAARWTFASRTGSAAGEIRGWTDMVLFSLNRRGCRAPLPAAVLFVVVAIQLRELRRPSRPPRRAPAARSARASPAARELAAAAFRRATTSAGVPAGTKKPSHWSSTIAEPRPPGRSEPRAAKACASPWSAR